MSLIKKIIGKIDVTGVKHKLEKIELTLGRIERRQLELMDKETPRDWEFQVSSQWGEDGIIQFLISKVPIINKVFVEFGVETYTEANTRFLLQNDNWSGLVIDGSDENIRHIKSDKIYWRFNLKAYQSFITKDNIDQIISENGISGDIGILSVDIDGNDYWVWEAIKLVQPRIVICEYNSLFGPHAKVSIPYESDFIRHTNGRPNTYYGASIAGLAFLANQKGYDLVAGNSAGNNVFFVKREFLNGLKVLRPDQAYSKAEFKESRDEQGNLTFPEFKKAQTQLFDYPVVNVETKKQLPFGEISKALSSTV